MLTVNCEQGSTLWLDSRVGCITASNFKDCTTLLKSGPNKGSYSGKTKEYAFKLAIERITGKRIEEDKFETYEIRRGHELEPDARLSHEEKEGVLVQQVGFALTDDSLFGASADGFIDDDGLAEYKCFIAPSSLMPILLDGNIEPYLPQVQGGMWVTGKQYAHFVLYCPALKDIGKDVNVFKVERDDDYIEQLEAGLWKFNAFVEKYKTILIGGKVANG